MLVVDKTAISLHVHQANFVETELPGFAESLQLGKEARVCCCINSKCVCVRERERERERERGG